MLTVDRQLLVAGYPPVKGICAIFGDPDHTIDDKNGVSKVAHQLQCLLCKEKQIRPGWEVERTWGGRIY